MTAEIATALRETADRAAIRAEWIAARYAMRAAGNRAADARRVAEAAERELAHANPFQADEEAWTNERALQEAQTEKEAQK